MRKRSPLNASTVGPARRADRKQFRRSAGISGRVPYPLPVFTEFGPSVPFEAGTVLLVRFAPLRRPQQSIRHKTSGHDAEEEARPGSAEGRIRPSPDDGPNPVDSEGNEAPQEDIPPLRLQSGPCEACKANRRDAYDEPDVNPCTSVAHGNLDGSQEGGPRRDLMTDRREGVHDDGAPLWREEWGRQRPRQESARRSQHQAPHPHRAWAHRPTIHREVGFVNSNHAAFSLLAPFDRDSTGEQWHP